MSDYLRSAFGYLNGSSNTNEYVGQLLEINNVKLRVNRLIAEGGWALVYAVEDVATGKEYALKRLIAVDENANKSIIQEIETLKKLSGHPNIIQFLCVNRTDKEDKKGYEYLLVTEICSGGTLADVLRETTVNSLGLTQICRVAYQATRAVYHMHTQKPQPIIHWDIKLENFLFGSDGLIKLCDFGSSSAQQILPDASWNAQKRSMLEDKMSRYTTPMYRSPEMLDTWNNEPIGPPVDCWALGCILYALVTLRHPFPEGNKLGIINARYPPLSPNPRLSCIHDLIKGCLEISPLKRMTTAMLLERLAAIAESNNFDPREPAKIEIKKVTLPPRPAPPPPPPPSSTAVNPIPPPRPAPPAPSSVGIYIPPTSSVSSSKSSSVYHHIPQKPPVHGGSGSSLFSSLKGGAGSIFRNIKDTSNKVMQTVQQSMSRTELDASYLTSRILIMPYPADGIESAYRANHVEDVRAYLQTRHPSPCNIQLYNLSRGRPSVTRLHGKHIDCTFAYASPDSNAPLLSALYQICQDIYRYLVADFNHIVVLYCNDGCRASATVACALLLYAGVLSTTEEAINLFSTRRCQTPQLQPSELRSINYMSTIHSGVHPHTRPLVLRSLLLQPVPLFTRAKDGCRPYAEIYSNGALVITTKKAEYEDMKLFDIMEGKVCLVLNDATVRGDVTIILYHARQQLGRVIGIKIASLHLHTGYISFTESALIFEKKDLDDVPEIGGKFKVILNVMIGEENDKINRIPAPWEIESTPGDNSIIPDPLFSSTLEMEETLDNFRITNDNKLPPIEPPIEKEIEKEPLVEKCPDINLPDQHQESENNSELTKNLEEFQEADLLNLGSSIKIPILEKISGSEANNPPVSSSTSGFDIFLNSSQNENDIFGNFASFNQATPKVNQPMGNDLLFGNVQSGGNNKSMNDLLFNEYKSSEKAESTSNFMFDPFGGSSESNLLGNWATNKTATEAPTMSNNTLKTPNEDGFPRNSSLPNFAAQNKDPFANLAGSLSAGLNASWNGTPRDSNTPQSASPAPAGTPIHSSPRMQNKTNTTKDSNTDFSVFNNNNNNIIIISSSSSSSSSNSNNNSNNNNNNGSSGNNKTQIKSSDAFGDLLGSQGYNFFSSRKTEKDSPKTINQMRKVEQAKTMDPDKLKIVEWTEGKKGNLRALLCSLHTVLWPEADRWQRYEMHQLVSAADVKKAYRKACLAVHPDKQVGTVNENMAKLIFMELNNAWSTFENDASQQNLFS